MRTCALLLSLVIPAWAEVANVRLAGVTNTQAILRYTAPDDGPCTVEVSESSSFTPLVHDVNEKLFVQASRDTRPEAWRFGRERAFVVGKRTVEKALDGRRYSRALKANTLHYFRIRCGGGTATGTFATANIPFGTPSADSFTAIQDPPWQGYYNFPSLDYDNRNEVVIDPWTGAEIRKLTLPKDSALDFSGRAPASCSGSNWLPSGSCAASYSAGAMEPLFAEHSTGWPNAYLARVNVYLKASISGAPSGDDRYLDVCLTLDGKTCASPTKAVDLTTCSASAVQGDCNGFGSTSAGFFDTWGTEFPLIGWGDVNGNKPTGFLFIPRTTSPNYKIAINEIRYSGKVFWGFEPYSAATDMVCGPAEIRDNGDGMIYHLCFARGANQFYAVEAARGRAYWLGPNMNGYQTNRSDVVFDPRDGRTFYVLDSSAVRVSRGRITGDVTREHAGHAEQPNSAFQWSLLTPEPYNLKRLLQLFDATFDEEWQSKVGGCALRGMAKGKLVFNCMPVQDSGGAAAVFDPQATAPSGYGGQGNVIAAMFVGKAGLTKYGNLHSLSMTTGPDNSPWIAVGTGRGVVSTSQFWGGPWTVKVRKPGGGDLGPTDTVFEIMLNNGVYEPADPQPGGVGDAVLPAEPGDLFLYNGDGNTTTQPTAGDEVIELVSKDTENRRWIVRRAGTLNAARMLAGSGFQAQGAAYTRPLTIPEGALLYAIPKYYPLSNPNHFISPVLWNFEADPHGNTVVFPAVNGEGIYPPKPGFYDADSGYASPQVVWHYFIGSHSSLQIEGAAADGGCTAEGQPALCYLVGTGSVPNVVNRPPDVYVRRDVPIGGNRASSPTSAYESHVSRAQYHAGERDKKLIRDVQPFAYGGASHGTSSPVAGTTNVYKVSGVGLNRKHFASFATCGDRILNDISGPGSVIDDSTPYAYCVALNAGECRSGSSPGDIYVNCPGVTLPACHVGPYSTNQAYDAWLPWKDICVGDRPPYTMGVLEIDAVGTSLRGESLRLLSSPYQRYQVQSIFQNAVAFPKNGWIVTAAKRHEAQDYFLVRALPLPPNRAPTGAFHKLRVELTSVPSGTHDVLVDFGYSEHGAPQNYFCTTRRETCRVNRASVDEANPFVYASEGGSGIACASGCTIELPVIPGRVIYWRALYRDAAGNVIRSDVQPPAAP